MIKEIMIGAAIGASVATDAETIKNLAIGATIGAGVAAIIVAAIKVYKAKKSGEKIESIYVDELNTGEIKKWFSDKLTKEVLKGVLLYPTPENIDKWKFDIDVSRHSNMLIQAVYDEEKDEVTDYREIIYTTLSSKLKELLDTNGGVLVVENKEGD